MKKYYACITHFPTGKQVEVGEDNEKMLQKSIKGCLRQKKWKDADVSVHVYTETY